MKIRVLGSAAGGGYPQWNCNCATCAAVRAGKPGFLGRTQSSIAVGDDTDWVLINASPDILAQLKANPVLQPGRTLRDTAIRGIVLTDGQVDHTTGLFMLRESTRPWPIWCTDSAYQDLTQGNPILKVLEHYCGVDRRSIALGADFKVDAVPGVEFHAFAVGSKPAPFSPHRETPQPGDNIALVLKDAASGQAALYAPGLCVIDEAVQRAMNRVQCVLVDGTFWTDDEMVAQGMSKKHARDIGHLPQSGPGGMIEWLDRLPGSTRKVLIHINNTNPILNLNSPQARELGEHGIEVATDGMEIEL